MSEVRVLFICLGNICRSPTAEGIFQQRVTQHHLAGRITVDSAGTGDWHVGSPPDRRSQAVAKARGYDISHLRARQVSREDFAEFHYILAMDNQNLRHLKAMKPSGYTGQLGLLLDFSRQSTHREVPDPYYGGDAGFQLVVDLIQDAADGLLEHIRRQHLNG